MKHRWRDGTTYVVFTPQEFVEKLAALVPELGTDVLDPSQWEAAGVCASEAAA